MKTKKDRLLLFVDTEFTDFNSMDLISIGIVSQQQHEFYAENSEYLQDLCSDFVKTTVLPKLNGGKYAMPYSKLKEKLQIWISDLLEEHSTVTFVFDYSGDWFLLGDLLIDYPQRDRISGAHDECEVGVEIYFMRDRSGEHHALNDAKALRGGFKIKYADKAPPY